MILDLRTEDELADNQLDGNSQPCIEIRDVMEARRFYVEALGWTEYETNEESLQLKMGSSRIACHFSPQLGKCGRVARRYGLMHGAYKPVPHCIVSLNCEDWKTMASKLKGRRLDYVIERTSPSKGLNAPPSISLFDPSGNLIEFRPMRHPSGHAGPWERMRSLVVLVSGAAAITMICVWFWRTNAPTQVTSIPAGTCPNSLFCTR